MKSAEAVAALAALAHEYRLGAPGVAKKSAKKTSKAV
jgi:hypothetical protein